jgi:hypothetical protein
LLGVRKGSAIFQIINNIKEKQTMSENHEIPEKLNQENAEREFWEGLKKYINNDPAVQRFHILNISGVPLENIKTMMIQYLLSAKETQQAYLMEYARIYGTIPETK